MPAQLTEVGLDMPTLLNIDPDAPYMEESPTEYDPGSAAAYGGDDGENSVDFADFKTEKEPIPLSELDKTNTTIDQAVRQWDQAMSQAGSEPCGLTIAEWEAHKAQMAADEAHRAQSKMMHVALAALAGFVAARWIR
jgi:hypothetical protein